VEWFILSLAYFVFTHVIAFSLCWLLIRTFRQLKLSRTITAFVLAWITLPVVAIILGQAPSALAVSTTWLASFVANGALLFFLGRPKNAMLAAAASPIKTPELPAAHVTQLNEDR
jgi:hypothetical protein